MDARRQKLEEMVERLEELGKLEGQREQKESVKAGLTILGLSMKGKEKARELLLLETQTCVECEREVTEDKVDTDLYFSIQSQRSMVLCKQCVDKRVSENKIRDLERVIEYRSKAHKKAYGELHDAARDLLNVTPYDGQGGEMAALRRVIWDDSDTEAQREAEEGKS